MLPTATRPSWGITSFHLGVIRNETTRVQDPSEAGCLAHDFFLRTGPFIPRFFFFACRRYKRLKNECLGWHGAQGDRVKIEITCRNSFFVRLVSSSMIMKLDDVLKR